ncbi:DUF4169 family protein [Jannaschia sp. 2305UL9-9]|uniref:DUF4169 family protein n=1 Tax=Jannaschia sp. 2305UL9-9 TaxID=3121638 RepID=UPI0035272E17
MSKITSLSRARKDRERAAKRKQGDENAARFGRTKAEKARDTAAVEKQVRRLDEHRRE